MALGSLAGGFTRKFRTVEYLTGQGATARSGSGWLLSALAFGQAAVIIASAVVAKFSYIDLALAQTQPLIWYLPPALLLAFLQHFVSKSMKLLRVDVLLAPTLRFGAVLGGLAIAFLVLIGILYLVKFSDFYSRGWFLTWAMISAFGIIALRWVMMRWAQNLSALGQLRSRVALFGTKEYVDAIKAQLLKSHSEEEVDGVYYVNGDDNASAYEVLQSLQNSVAHNHYDRIVIGAPASEVELIRLATNSLSSWRPEVLLCTTLERPLVQTNSLRIYGGLPVGVVSAIPLSEQNRMLKRSLDVILAGIGLLLLSPLLVVVALLIKLDSRGSVLFRQRRFGQNNKVFSIYKFRTMTVVEDGETVTQAKRNDARVTRVGRILRSSSIDELPQLINVLLGDMSIVGPRPHAIAHDQEFEKSLDLFGLRRQVLPGLTGWAQVNGYRGETKAVSDVRGRIEHDLYYIENWSIWLDIEIIARTVVTVFRGAY